MSSYLFPKFLNNFSKVVRKKLKVEPYRSSYFKNKLIFFCTFNKNNLLSYEEITSNSCCFINEY